VLFADYGVLAAAGRLPPTLQLDFAPYARDAFRVPLTPEAETQKRFSLWEPQQP
jgi:hypothetical protein